MRVPRTNDRGIEEEFDTEVQCDTQWCVVEHGVEESGAGDLVKLTFGGLILAYCVGREIDPSGHVPDDRRVSAGHVLPTPYKQWL